MAAAIWYSDGLERVAMGRSELEVLAGAMKGPHLSDLEQAVAELDSYHFEQAVESLNADGFE